MLWFLHADAGIGDGAVGAIEKALAADCVVGGYFRIQLPRDRLIYRATDTLAHYLGLLTRIRCGDHGFFCRALFEEIGGFPDVPLMEDVEFYRTLRRHGTVVTLSPPLMASPRRYEKIGATRLTLAYGFIAGLYALSAPLATLARIYWRTCASSHLRK